MDALKQDKVTLKETTYKRPVGIDEGRLPPQVMVRYLYQPGEGEGDKDVVQQTSSGVWKLFI